MERRRRATGWLDDLDRDVRYACRAFGRDRAFTFVVLASLALGIGANTAVFSLINTLMLRTLPVRAPGELVEILSQYPGEPRMNMFSREYLERVRDRTDVFSAVTGDAPSRFRVSADGVDGADLTGGFVAGSFFEVLGLQPALGRLIGPRDDTADGAAVAVLGWSAWTRLFQQDPAIAGKRIVVSGVPAVVVGVAPAAFSGLQTGLKTELWVPTAMRTLLPRGAQGPDALRLIARLKPGVPLEQARAQMRVLNRPRVEELARTSGNSGWLHSTIHVERAGAGYSALREVFSTPLLALMAIVALLLALACVNIAGLLLARAAARQREIAVRVSLGAGRWRLARQALTESLILSAAGAALGIALAAAGARALVTILLSALSARGIARYPIELDVSPDLRVLLFAVAVTAVTGVLFGLAPALTAAWADPASMLRQGGPWGESRSRRLFGKSLVAGQLALAIVLVSTAGLFAHHLSSLRGGGLGFDPSSVLVVAIDPQGSGLDREHLSVVYRQLLERFATVPGVRSASLSAVIPISGAGASRFIRAEGFQEKPEDRRYVSLNMVAPRYFETLRTPLLAGRDFTFEDAGRSRAIVNDSLARYYFGSAANALGRHVAFEGQGRSYEIVGVAGDAKYDNVHERPPRTLYLDAFEERSVPSNFVLRTAAPFAQVAAAVRAEASGLVKNLQIARVTTLAGVVDASIVPERTIASLSSVFAALGALLAAVGLYGLLAYTVARRTGEIGIRMALGASPADVARMLLKDAAILVAFGLAAGLPLAMWAARLAASVIVNVPAGATFGIAVALASMAAVAIVAAFGPARSAARVQPVEALRHD